MYVHCVFVCVFAHKQRKKQEDCYQHWFAKPSGLDSVTFLSLLFIFNFLRPSHLWLSTLSRRAWRPVCVCVTVCLCLAPCDPSFYVSFSAGISLLVPHGGIAEDTTWEMYMIISQEDSRWAGGPTTPLTFQSFSAVTQGFPSTSSSSSARKPAAPTSKHPAAWSHAQRT